MGHKITFPIIADLNKEVATKYGMIMPGESKTETSRCVFVIDDKQIIRAMIYYPLTTGWNMDEILRLLQALQATDKNKIATPANLRPGDKVIVPAPNTQEMAEERVKDKSVIARQVGQPLFKVRSSLREMTAAGLIEQEGEKFVIASKGKEKLRM